MRLFLFAMFMGLLALTPAHADDWRVISVQGEALVSKSGAWISLRIDDVVSDDSPIRTLSNSSVEFTRDREKISVLADTQIRIVDRAGQRYTTVNDIFGVVAIEANVENVQHFAVKTKYLAAVVKGTIFSVAADSSSSSVAVTRGLVQVTDTENGKTLDVPAGKSTTVGKNLSPTLKDLPKGSAAADAAKAMAAASAAEPPPGGGNPDGKDPKADSKSDPKADPKADSKTDGKDADKAAAEAAAATKAAKGDGAGKEPTPDEIAAGAKAAGLEKGKFKSKDAAEGAKIVAAVAKSAEPEIEAPAPPPPKVVAAPLISLILQLDSAEQTAAWLGLAAVFFGIGSLLNMILRDVGFGAAVNGLIAMVGGIVGAEVRDQFFFDEDWFNREPYVSIGLITLFSFLAVMAACVMKYRELSKPAPSAAGLGAAKRPKPRERFIK